MHTARIYLKAPPLLKNVGMKSAAHMIPIRTHFAINHNNTISNFDPSSKTICSL